MSVTKGLLVRFDALPGKEDDVKEFLDSGRALVGEEPATTAWFAIRLGPSSFGIFDVFPDDAGRDAHLSGAVAAALGENTGKLFSEPTIEKLDVLGSKLPA
ncbi:putative quinol monooxygenase [Janibacter hoylei]|uniref:putative quinol monooxygenase n=1 Tax=Janibacter hoylei TaxID=364298 RepID=UPI0021A40181|nr:antibiotic biosynthesis monooxygenase [Janibacter hoylei]MCT1620137.1 antibiotic biosynthesis monooxygenase [Janibacter hoylei]MCT2294151.1 antibiotic biosynthesis monooxygenase [Janibacter hoylei]MCW4601678.1 antibiotic biosynthesis monooxygenase [Janibacter hoylei]